MSAVTESIDILVIGAGVVGLAVADALAKEMGSERTIFLIDRHAKFGQEASSHNSEVIHAGIYYKPGSYKATSCIRGRTLLYSYCDSHGIPHRKCGKYIVSPNTESRSETIYFPHLRWGI